MSSKGQEFNNRSQGQRIRRNKENVGGLIETQEQQGAVLSQHDRDIKLLKARVTELERERAKN